MSPYDNHNDGRWRIKPTVLADTTSLKHFHFPDLSVLEPFRVTDPKRRQYSQMDDTLPAHHFVEGVYQYPDAIVVRIHLARWADDQTLLLQADTPTEEKVLLDLAERIREARRRLDSSNARATAFHEAGEGGDF